MIANSWPARCPKERNSLKILRILSLETLNTLYLESEWLYVFTDDSKLTDNSNAGAGVCCDLFSFCSLIGIHRTAFNAEIASIHIAVCQLFCHTDRVSKVVILSDSRAVLQAISSIKALMSVDILKCQQLIDDILQSHIDIALQWIPSHCGIDGKENAECLAKKGTKIIQTSSNIVPFYDAKRITKKYYREHFWGGVEIQPEE
ncbi:RNase H domain-containing protein [Trichonephila clavipes]|uniref:RNase H domain-containing protein n=1 Tax=Trichonephila clavipes TaxID=2585209 RepID=A0A8X6SNU9_TRICX|nr:RNase H domain-containing protein [Trichonephila clavipes]